MCGELSKIGLALKKAETVNNESIFLLDHNKATDLKKTFQKKICYFLFYSVTIFYN